MAPKIDEKSTLRRGCVFLWLWRGLGVPKRAKVIKREPIGSQREPKRSQKGAKRSQNEAKMEPKSDQNASKNQASEKVAKMSAKGGLGHEN